MIKTRATFIPSQVELIKELSRKNLGQVHTGEVFQWISVQLHL